MYAHILVPTDGSETAAVAVEHAVDLAGKYDATIHALYVIDVDATSYALGSEQIESIRQGDLEGLPEVRAQAEGATGQVAAAAGDGVAVEEHVAVGEPSRAIRAFVTEHDIDLIVMGSHGRSGLSRVILGSVAEKVLRRTHLPVLVVDSGGVEGE